MAIMTSKDWYNLYYFSSITHVLMNGSFHAKSTKKSSPLSIFMKFGTNMDPIEKLKI